MESVRPGVALVAVRTPTLPPATHTNSWVLGEGELLVVDPASPYDDERQRLLAEVSARLSAGEVLRGLFLTHHHQDHVRGAVHLQQSLRQSGHEVPIIAHPVTAELLEGSIHVDELWDEPDVREVGGLRLRVLHTPGHAPGHLCLLDEASSVLVAGDMVAGVGTIAIDPDEGDLGDYLHHLERLRGLKPTALLPAHGPVLAEADAVLAGYIAHRHMRTEQIREALQAHGAQQPIELAPRVYPQLEGAWLHLASRQILTHLHWLKQHGVARPTDLGWVVE